MHAKLGGLENPDVADVAWYAWASLAVGSMSICARTCDHRKRRSGDARASLGRRSGGARATLPRNSRAALLETIEREDRGGRLAGHRVAVQPRGAGFAGPSRRLVASSAATPEAVHLQVGRVQRHSAFPTALAVRVVGPNSVARGLSSSTVLCRATPAPHPHRSSSAPLPRR